MTFNRRALLQSAGGFTVAACAAPVFAQGSFPSKPIKLIVPFAPGGANDIVARLLATKLAVALGQPVVVDNRAGAGGAVGAQLAARSEADGHTLLLHSSSLVINPFLIKDSGYDWRTDFTPVSRITQYPLVLAVNPTLPAKTMPEFLALARARGSDLFFGSAGNGSTQHLVGELFNSMAGTKMKHVPYRGNGPATAALLANDIQVMFDIVPNALTLGSAGKIRLLAVTSKTPSPTLPDVPTVHGSGVPNFESTPWQALFLPKNAPAPVVQTWLVAVRKALADKDVQTQLAGQAFQVLGTPPDELASYMQQESAKWGKVIADAKIQSDT